MELLTVTLAASQTRHFAKAGRYFEIIDSTYAVNVAFTGADGVARQAEAATDLFATSSTAASAAWGHTLDASGELIDKLLQTAQGTVAGANAIASQAVASYTPTENKNADAIKYAAIAVAVFVAFKVLKG